ncbi:hypothetical protein PR202_gb24914 [Eleusine coracana subsp. coracana]|uniref:ATP-dependent DNA helicase CHR12 n=1 Tax=Eleusine coracana subsp. coracana TaxID=191504 RepID=A0AAV5FMF0_ELECO|nr:hypothetical protein PR202_gb24914 [Eleusine coracana subsp. coracana]
MSASVDAAAVPVTPAFEDAGDAVEQARTLIGALNLLSRNLPLPPAVLRAVSSIYHDGDAVEEEVVPVVEGDAEKVGDEEIAVADGAGKGYTAAHGAAEVRALVLLFVWRISIPLGSSGLFNVHGETINFRLVLNLGAVLWLWLKFNLITKGATLIEELEDAIFKNQRTPISYSELAALKEGRFNASIQHRLAELEGLPSTRGEDLQMKCLLELYGLKLLDLQKKVRSDVSAEYWLHKKCAYPERQLFDWGMMRIQYPFTMYGIGDTFLVDSDDIQRKKRFTERISRLEEEEKNQIDMRKRKFFAEIMNACREHQAWHVRARQRISRIEKTRMVALKNGDQEAYMRMVEESKNERLKMLLDKTNELLEGIGKAVQRQKDAEHVSRPEVLEVPKGSESEDYSQMSGIKSESPGGSPSDDDADPPESANESKFNAGRRLDSTVHSIEEKVTEQPSALEGGELRPYQLEGLQWMLSLFNNNLNGILADEMGLGKTIQTIAFIAYLLEKKEVTGPHLIIAPKAVLPNWSNEFKTWAPSIGAILYDGRPDERKALRETYFGEGVHFNVLLTHYDLILKDKKFLRKVLRPFLLRRKKDEVEKYLPVKTQVILKCDMSAWQKAYYEQVMSRERVALGSGLRSKALQNLSMQLRKCCNHPYLFVEHYNMYQREEIVRASGKFELLDRLLPKLQRAGHRVLLFSQMTKLLDILEVYLQMYSFKYMRLDGSTKTEERGKLLADFNKKDSDYFIFLLSTRAGGLGLNLQTADTVIIFDSDWNPQMDQQAEDRAHRIGQKNEVRVFVLVSVGSIEEEILERAKQKMGIDAKVIQAGLFNTTSTAQDRRAMLQEILRKGTSSLGTDIPSEREINRLAARNEHEFWLFEKMDEERRQRENYKSRLMDGNEVPDWVFNNNEPWMKSDDDGFEDIPKMTPRAKRTTYSSDMQGVDISRRKRPRSVENSDDASNPTWTPERGTTRVSSYSKDENEDDGDDEVITSSLQQGSSFTWKTLGRKRSSHLNSSDSKGRPSF